MRIAALHGNSQGTDLEVPSLGILRFLQLGFLNPIEERFMGSKCFRMMMKPSQTPLNKAPSQGGKKEPRERKRGHKYEHSKGLMTWHNQMSISIYLFITLDGQKCDGMDSFEVVGGWVLAW